MEGWHNVLECPISERASFYIKLTPVAGRFGFSVVQSLGCLRTAGSVRFLSFFFPPPPSPEAERGPRRSNRGSIGIDRWPPRSLARESIVGTDDERSSIVRHAISLKKGEGKEEAIGEVDEERMLDRPSTSRRRTNQDSRRDSWRSTRRVSKRSAECARPGVSAAFVYRLRSSSLFHNFFRFGFSLLLRSSGWNRLLSYCYRVIDSLPCSIFFSPLKNDNSILYLLIR